MKRRIFKDIQGVVRSLPMTFAVDVESRRKGERSQGWVWGLHRDWMVVPFTDWGWEWEVGTCYRLNVSVPPSHSYVETYSPV